MRLTQLVKRNCCLLIEVEQNPYGVDGVCRGHVADSQHPAVVNFGGLSGAG